MTSWIYVTALSCEKCEPMVYPSLTTMSLTAWKAAIIELSWIFSLVPEARRYLMVEKERTEVELKYIIYKNSTKKLYYIHNMLLDLKMFSI